MNDARKGFFYTLNAELNCKHSYSTGALCLPPVGACRAPTNDDFRNRVAWLLQRFVIQTVAMNAQQR